MKTLLLLRHAKSSWKDSSLPDQDRPLNRRGREAAPRIGRLLNEQQFSVDLALCSTSVRTRQTADLVQTKLNSPFPITFRDSLYGASAEEILQILCEVEDQADCVLLIAHNPGLEDFLTQMTGSPERFPTAALAEIQFDIDQWSALHQQQSGRLIHLWRPRELDD